MRSTIPPVGTATPVSRQIHVRVPKQFTRRKGGGGVHVLAHSAASSVGHCRCHLPSNGCSWGDVLVRVPRVVSTDEPTNWAECFRKQEGDCAERLPSEGLPNCIIYVYTQGATLAPLYCFLLPFHLHGSFRDCGTRKPQLLFHRPPFFFSSPSTWFFQPAHVHTRKATQTTQIYRQQTTSLRREHCSELHTVRHSRLCDWGSREASHSRRAFAIDPTYAFNFLFQISFSQVTPCTYFIWNLGSFIRPTKTII